MVGREVRREVGREVGRELEEGDGGDGGAPPSVPRRDLPLDEPESVPQRRLDEPKEGCQASSAHAEAAGTGTFAPQELPHRMYPAFIGCVASVCG